jgi:phosphatidylserine/phosphatidylglycerophosphate/cardiolipin synthase-like enzyme
MSAARRRGHLFGIYYYRTPDAQARRIDKMLDDAAAVAERMGGKKK